jgi:hypothetical protein
LADLVSRTTTSEVIYDFRYLVLKFDTKAATLLALLRILKVPGSNLGPGVGCSLRIADIRIEPLQANAGMVP